MPGVDYDPSSLTCAEPQGTMTLYRRMKVGRGRRVTRRSASFGKDRCRSRSADNVCVTVNTPTAELEGQNDLRKVWHLVEQEQDNDWGSTSGTSDDDGSMSSGSDSDNILSDSYTHDDENPDEPCQPQTVVITDKLRQLASKTHTVQKISHEAHGRQPVPTVEVEDMSATVVIQDDIEELPEDACEEEIRQLPVDAFTGEAQSLPEDANEEIRQLPEDAYKGEMQLLPEDAKEEEIQQLPVDAFTGETQLLPEDANEEEIQQLPEDAFTGEIQHLPEDANEEEIRQLPVNAFIGEMQQLAEDVAVDELSEDVCRCEVQQLPEDPREGEVQKLPEDACEDEVQQLPDDAVECVCSENMNITNSDNVGVLNFEASDNEKLVPELVVSTTRPESPDETPSSDTGMCAFNPSLVAGGGAVVSNVESFGDDRLVPEPDLLTNWSESQGETVSSLFIPVIVINDDAVGSNLGASGSEKLETELAFVISQSESQDVTPTSDADKSEFIPSITEYTDDVDYAERNSNLTYTMVSDSERTSDVSLGTFPITNVKQHVLEYEMFLSTDEGAGCNWVRTESDEHFAGSDHVGGGVRWQTSAGSDVENSVDDMQDTDEDTSYKTVPTESDYLFGRADSDGGGERKSQTSSASSFLSAVDDVEDARSVRVVVEDELFYTDAELDALMAANEDHEGIPEHGDTVEEEPWLGLEKHFVYRLARQFSSRAKEMSSLASPYRRGQIPTSRSISADEASNKDSDLHIPTSRSISADEASNKDSDLSSIPSQFLQTRKSEDSPPVSSAAAWTRDSTSEEMVSKWNDDRSQAKSVDEVASFPQTNVRDTIRKWNQKASSSNVTTHSRIYLPASESVHLSSSVEDSPEQNEPAPRQQGSLVQERVQMLHSGNKFS